jgi:hypothetical protein
VRSAPHVGRARLDFSSLTLLDSDHFTCFTSTKVQILTPEDRLAQSRWSEATQSAQTRHTRTHIHTHTPTRPRSTAPSKASSKEASKASSKQGRWRCPPRPDFVILGASKCGTRSRSHRSEK